MKKSILLLIAMYILFYSFSLLASDKIDQSDFAKSSKKISKIIYLPFWDYTNSDYKYLSSYLSEVFKKNLKTHQPLKVIDTKYFGKKSCPASSDLFQDRERTVDFLKSINVDVGIIGRYIIHGNTIFIESGLVYAANGKYEEAKSFEGAIDDNFFSTLSDYTISYNEWILAKIFKETTGVSVENDKSFFVYQFNKIKKSKIGGIFKGRWAQFFLIITVFFIFSLILNSMFKNLFLHLASKTETNVDEEIITLSRKPVLAVLLLFGFKIAFFSLNITGNFISVVSNIITALMIVSISYFLVKSAEIIIKVWESNIVKKNDSRIDNDLVPLFNKIVKIIIYSVGIIMVLSLFKIDIAPLIASLGIAGFAIGFAVKDTLSNIIGGIILNLDHSFVVGDKVSIDGDVGIIQEVGLRNTKLLTYNNELIIYPNGEMMNKKYKNFVLPDPKVRVVVNFGVAYGTNIDMVEKVVVDALKKIDEISLDPEPAVDFIEMADFSLNFIAKFWVPLYANQYAKKIEATKLIYNTLNENNIDIPFPTNSIYIEKNN